MHQLELSSESSSSLSSTTSSSSSSSPPAGVEGAGVLGDVDAPDAARPGKPPENDLARPGNAPGRSGVPGDPGSGPGVLPLAFPALSAFPLVALCLFGELWVLLFFALRARPVPALAGAAPDRPR